MTTMGFMMGHASFDALYIAANPEQKANAHKGVRGLRSVKGTSLLGKHNGVADDQLLDLLEEEFL